MADPRIQLRDPWLALILAFVLPGLGHAYQRRYLKAAIFFVCISGLFCWGMGIAEGKAVYYRPFRGELAGQRKEFIGYLAQVGIGLPALPAIYQHKRYHSPANMNSDQSPGPIDAHFEGEIDVDLPSGTEVTTVSGRITLEPGLDRFQQQTLVGKFVGKSSAGDELTFTLGEQTIVGKRVDASPNRSITSRILDEQGYDKGIITGSISRPFWNYFEVPLSEVHENDINTRLGTKFELAYVLAMLAGMLNLLVAYDAFEGPAYGFDIATDPQAKPK